MISPYIMDGFGSLDESENLSSIAIPGNLYKTAKISRYLTYYYDMCMFIEIEKNYFIFLVPSTCKIIEIHKDYVFLKPVDKIKK
jgi:hypothetical protein